MERERIMTFTLPTYREIPNVGLYLDQVSKYINECFSDVLDFSITNSMISNYVKHDLVANPVKKLYYRDQIASLLFITLTKSVIALEDLKALLEKQNEICETEKAYSYFADTFNRSLHNIFTGEMIVNDTPLTKRQDIVNTIVSTVVHQIYLNAEIGTFTAE